MEEYTSNHNEQINIIKKIYTDIAHHYTLYSSNLSSTSSGSLTDMQKLFVESFTLMIEPIMSLITTNTFKNDKHNRAILIIHSQNIEKYWNVVFLPILSIRPVLVVRDILIRLLLVMVTFNILPTNTKIIHDLREYVDLNKKSINKDIMVST